MNQEPTQMRRPSPTMTDEEWQKIFQNLKDETPESQHRLIARRDARSERGCNEEQLERYCAYINDILGAIRRGQTDFCYYIYQIADLLRFERNRLRTEYLPDEQCFKVWLDKSR